MDVIVHVVPVLSPAPYWHQDKVISPSWLTSARTGFLNLSLCCGWFVRPITPGHQVGLLPFTLSGFALEVGFDILLVILQTLCTSMVLINSLMVRTRWSNGRSLPLTKAIFMARKLQEHCNLCLQVHSQNKRCWKRQNCIPQFCKEGSSVWRVWVTWLIIS